MAEATQYAVELKEAILVLIRHLELHEGIWAMSVEFGLGVGNFGVSPEEARPSAFVQVQKLGLVRAEAEGPLAIDASKVNPAPGTKSLGKPTKTVAQKKTPAKTAARS